MIPPTRLAAFLFLALPLSAQVTQRVSVSSSGAQGAGGSIAASISANGRFAAFVSSAANLVPDDTNGYARDVFVRDLCTGTTDLASLDPIGNQHIGNCRFPSLSADGHILAYQADRLGPDSTGPDSDCDVFVRNRIAGTTVHASVASDGGLGDGWSAYPSVSLDGRHVVFTSRASNLVPGDTNGTDDIFIRDLFAGTTERVSVSTLGMQGNGDGAWFPSISADGSRVSFGCMSTNLIDGETTGAGAVFMRDRILGTTSQVSLTSLGSQPNGWSDASSISADGRVVVFVSIASDLVPGDTNSRIDVFVRDLARGTTERVSVASSKAQGSNHSGLNGPPSISPDGRVVAFTSMASDLVAEDANGAVDVFVHDRKTGETWMASRGLSGHGGNSTSVLSARSLSMLGGVVTFSGLASDIVPEDTNGSHDVFVSTRGSVAPAGR